MKLGQSRKVYGKLVRDRIPEIIAGEGRTCGTEIMNAAEYQRALLEKLVEESQEAARASGGDLIREIADLCEVIDALVAAFEIDRDELSSVQHHRRAERGGFDERIRLLWTE